MADDVVTRRVLIDGEEKTVKLRKLSPKHLKERRAAERAALQKSAAKKEGKTEPK